MNWFLKLKILLPVYVNNRKLKCFFHKHFVINTENITFATSKSQAIHILIYNDHETYFSAIKQKKEE